MLKNTVNILTVQKHLFLVNYTKNNLYLISNSKLSNISTITSTTSNEQNEKETIEKQIDPFTEEFGKNQIKISTVQRFILSIGSSLAALVNPRRHDMIACLGETTGVSALENIYKQMKLSDEGRQILIEKPRINTKTIDMNSLKKLPDNTFGKAYFKFLEENNVTPDSRMDVRFMDNPELAYVMTRYRECHDLIHTILGMPTNMLGEVAVKWVEALNTGLPMCYGGAVFGAVRLRPKQRLKYTTIYLPWAISNGKVIKPLLNVYWERRWNQDINELRKELGITVL